jgi:hypothetical protein
VAGSVHAHLLIGDVIAAPDTFLSL